MPTKLTRSTMPAESRERRITYGRVQLETRDVGETKRQFVVGHASVFNVWTTLYEGRYFTWREIIRPGAYKRAIAEKQDVRALFNHDPNFVLGRTRSGTLVLSEDDKGLFTETDAPTTQTIRDLVLAPIEREDITGMSFAFSPAVAEKTTTVENEDDTYVIDRGGERITIRYEGDREIEEREILDCDLFDISPVTYPQYTQTDVALRSSFGIEDYVKERDQPRKRSAPKRDELRRWLMERGVALTPAK